jgi:hypothetical protein
LSASQSFNSNSVVVPVGLARILYAVIRRLCLSITTGTDFEASTLLPIPTLLSMGKSSQKLWLPYRVLPMHHRKRLRHAEARRSARPFRGFFPFSVFPALRSHIVPALSTVLVMFRPQGFSPSRRFAPRMTCQAYFILVPLMGFFLRGFHPHVMPYALADAGSLMEFNLTDYSTWSLLQGYITSHETRPQVRGLARLLCRMPPWTLSPPRFLDPCID